MIHEFFRPNHSTEVLGLPQGYKKLHMKQAYSHIFRLEHPIDTNITSAIHAVTESFTNLSEMLILFGIEHILINLKEKELKLKNIFALKLTQTQEPWFLLERQLFDINHPYEIRLNPNEKLKKFEEFLRQNKILTNGEIAGALLLFTRSSVTKPIFKKTIALGITDKDNNIPLGIIFCSDEILDYNMVDNIDETKKRKRKPKKINKPILIRHLAPERVTI